MFYVSSENYCNTAKRTQIWHFICLTFNQRYNLQRKNWNHKSLRGFVDLPAPPPKWRPCAAVGDARIIMAPPIQLADFARLINCYVIILSLCRHWAGVFFVFLAHCVLGLDIMQEKQSGIFTLTTDPIWRLLTPLLITSGFQQGFFYADYTKVIPS